MAALPKHPGHRFLNFTGRRFGKLVVMSYAGKIKGGHAWNCVCDCGNKKVYSVQDLHRRKACGCMRGGHNFSHGHTKKIGRSRTYCTWSAMKQRCINPKNTSYKNYGGRGIKVCDRWLHSFVAFLADMGERPPGLSIDRKDNDGNYEPGNCRWSTDKIQSKNRRQNGNRKLSTKDVILIRAETKRTWFDYERQAKRYGVTSTAIRNIIYRKSWNNI